MRRDVIVQFIAECLKEKGFVEHVEPHFSAVEGLRKPDIIAVKERIATLIDPQKVVKYKTVRGLAKRDDDIKNMQQHH